MDEEKTIDEEKTVDEAVEEMTGEMKEFEPVAFDEVIKESEPERKDAPILRDAPEPADMNMIHKHLDNFLAKIAGETPIDENVRDSTEYWLKRIAENLPGGGGKLYLHTFYLSEQSQIKYRVITTTPEFENWSAFVKWLYDNGYRSMESGLVPPIYFWGAGDSVNFTYRVFYATNTSRAFLTTHSVKRDGTTTTTTIEQYSTDFHDTVTEI